MVGTTEHTRIDIAAVDTELSIYKLVLWFVTVPVFCVFIPVYFVQNAVVDAYRMLRRLAALLFDVTLPQVEEIRFEGHAFFFTAGGIVAGVLIAFLTLLHLRTRAAPRDRTLPDAQVARRYRPPPMAVRALLEGKVTQLWQALGRGGDPVPGTLCFASTGIAACVVYAPAGPAVAVSSALLDQLKGPATPLADVVLLHELAHVLGRDASTFRFLAAFVKTLRQTFAVAIALLGAIAVTSSAFEIMNVAGIEVRSPSIYAFAIDDIRDLLFPYASMVLVLRYVGLIIMLTELRADLRAALAAGGLGIFAAAVRSDAGFRPSTNSYFWRTIVGTRVTHLAATERLMLMEDANRLLTPKYRYFAWSIVLALLMILDGSVAFTGFETGLELGLVATIAALNAMTVAMLVSFAGGPLREGELSRLFVVTLSVVAGNSILLFTPTAVMGTTSELYTAFLNPAEHYSPAQTHEALANWAQASLRPLVDAAVDGRLLLWILAIFGSIWIVRRGAPLGRVGHISPILAVVTAGATFVIAAAAPFATYILLPSPWFEIRPGLMEAFRKCGPPAAVLVGATLGYGLGAALPQTPAGGRG